MRAYGDLVHCMVLSVRKKSCKIGPRIYLCRYLPVILKPEPRNLLILGYIVHDR